MYLIMNEQRHSCARRIKTKDTVKFLTVKPAPDAIGGTVKLFRDDGFLLAEDDLDAYARCAYSGTLLTATNAPPPRDPLPTPEQRIAALEQSALRIEDLAAAITEGVNEV